MLKILPVIEAVSYRIFPRPAAVSTELTVRNQSAYRGRRLQYISN